MKIIDVLKKIEDDGMLNIQFAQSSGCRSLFAHIARIKNSANSTYYKHILDQLDKKILHLL